MKICSRCKREFIPSSRHLCCPKCIDQARQKTKKCIDCGILIRNKSTRCVECFKRHYRKMVINPERTTISSFRAFLRRARRRNKLNDLTELDLLTVWESQKGICPYSGVHLNLPVHGKCGNLITTASVDRIKSEMPYTKGNIQFVSIAINFMKSTLSHEETIFLCKTIANHWR